MEEETVPKTLEALFKIKKTLVSNNIMLIEAIINTQLAKSAYKAKLEN